MVQVLNGDTELSHRITSPVRPVTVNGPLLDPVQIDVPPVVDPPALSGVTTTTNESLFTDGQLPLPITALKAVLWLKAELVYPVVVLLIGVQVVNGDTELSQRIILPV